MGITLDEYEFVDHYSSMFGDNEGYRTTITEKGKEHLGELVKYYFTKKVSFQFLGSTVKDLGSGIEIARSENKCVSYGTYIDPNDFEKYFGTYIETQNVKIRYLEIDDTIYVIQYQVTKVNVPTNDVKIPLEKFDEMMKNYKKV